MSSDPNQSRTADVVVIGGGIIGSSIALRLAQARLKVAVLDRGQPGAEASSAAAGMITPQGEHLDPASFRELCIASHALYPDFVTEIEAVGGMQVGFRRNGSLLAALSEEESGELDAIDQAQRGSGLPIERLTAGMALSRAPSLSERVLGGLYFPQDYWVDSELLVRALVDAARLQGVTFCPGKRVRKLNVVKGRIESVEAGEDSNRKVKISAGQFVLAAGCWSPELAELIGVRLEMKPCRGQILEFESPKELPMVVRAGHHYLVPRAGRRVVLGTTAEYAGYQKAVTAQGMRSVLEGARRIVPGVERFRFLRAWAGLRPDTSDHLPVLGYGEIPNLVFATGHFRNGILLAPITAQLISEAVLTGSASRAIDAYDPARFAVREQSKKSGALNASEPSSPANTFRGSTIKDRAVSAERKG